MDRDDFSISILVKFKICCKDTKKYLTLDALWEPFCSDEKERLIKIFFAHNDEGTSERDLLRRFTLGQILYIISSYEKQGYRAGFKDVDWSLVYPIYYYNVLHLESDSVVP